MVTCSQIQMAASVKAKIATSNDAESIEGDSDDAAPLNVATGAAEVADLLLVTE